ncbi:hypothetical protein ABEB36_009293 [Hypothenemus hampei]|uniref:Uncharacterized protein n=1 Tax=Hypothenemus hampei TaxID=57062 RepID=A0ABD1EK26_HYPHA
MKARLLEQRERQRERLMSETSEQRKARLSNQICTKRCYPNQVYIVRYNTAALRYLPIELSSKTTLLLCSRQTHVTSNKTIAPPKAFWKNLDPGFIPDVVQVLTQAEQRLLGRIIPFIKVVKFTGLYGRALRWLIRYNPLYKDVRIDENVQINEDDLIRLSAPELSGDGEPERFEIRNSFIPINDVARIIRASWHQGDHNIFTSGYADVQCSAMSLANIVRAAIFNPNR